MATPKDPETAPAMRPGTGSETAVVIPERALALRNPALKVRAYAQSRVDAAFRS